MSTFKDYFSKQAQAYVNFRPLYPEALFAYLASVVQAHEAVWDCGTGNGQAAVALARYFSSVIATDASEAQIRAAPVCANIAFRVAPAECSGIDNGTVDLITVAQALHWFDADRFYTEAKRVLKPGGVMAAWSYGVIELDTGPVNDAVQDFYYNVVGSYWPPERRHVENGYRELPFPFAELTPPAFNIRESWSLEGLSGYIRSWSATRCYLDAHEEDPVIALEQRLLPLWGDPSVVREIRWPLTFRVGKHEG